MENISMGYLKSAAQSNSYQRFYSHFNSMKMKSICNFIKHFIFSWENPYNNNNNNVLSIALF